jgi:WD40 repeat protein
MPTSNPTKLKATKQQNFRGIAFAMARQPESNRVFLGTSLFKVMEAADVTAAKFELDEIGKHTSYVTSLGLAGKTLISGGYDGKLKWWDVDQQAPLFFMDRADFAEIRSVAAHKKWIRNLAVSPNGKIIASVADDMVCRLWDAATGKLQHELKGHKEKTPNHFPSMLFGVAFSADGKYLATGDKVGHIVVWDPATGKSVKTMETTGLYTWDGRQRLHSIGGIRSLAFSPDGKSLAAGGIGHIGNVDHLDGKARVEIFDLETGKQTQVLEKTKFKGLVERLAFHPKGEWLLAAGGANDGFLVFFDWAKKAPLREEKVRFHVHAVALNEAADTLLAAGHGGLNIYEMKA